jgi:hypothetical protein
MILHNHNLAGLLNFIFFFLNWNLDMRPIPTLKTFEIEINPGGVAILALNRAERANALNDELLQVSSYK